MSFRKTQLVFGEYYHIYNRGNSKQEIFIDKEDYDRFIKLLFLCNSRKSINFRDDIIKAGIDTWDFDRGEPIISIGSWVLMPNHFHLYITSSPKQGLGLENAIPIFMNKLGTAYVKYFNKKYNRTGGLFEGKFKSVHIENDGQAKYLFSYIHLNPVKLIDKNWKENGIKDLDKALKFLETYKCSSYSDYRGIKRSENTILDIIAFPDYFSTIKDFDTEILEWLNYKDL